jgi:nucleoside-diphosphate-sugar epimerase
MGASATTLVIVGAGDVGGRLARLRAGRTVDVIAARRRDVDVGEGVRSLQVDVVTGAGIARLPRRPDALVFCVAPDQRDEAAYRSLFVDGVRRLLDRIEMTRLLMVSSTAVYAEDAGEWVDEATPARPPAFNGRVLLEAESELATHPQACVLRLSGLYGPGREAMMRRARSAIAGQPRWSNRVHVDDAASALSLLLDLQPLQRLYLGSDDMPVLESELLAWLRESEGLPAVAPETGPMTGRRVSNARLREAGWMVRHPDFRSGYGALLVG